MFHYLDSADIHPGKTNKAKPSPEFCVHLKTKYSIRHSHARCMGWTAAWNTLHYSTSIRILWYKTNIMWLKLHKSNSSAVQKQYTWPTKEADILVHVLSILYIQKAHWCHPEIEVQVKIPGWTWWVIYMYVQSLCGIINKEHQASRAMWTSNLLHS